MPIKSRHEIKLWSIYHGLKKGGNVETDLKRERCRESGAQYAVAESESEQEKSQVSD